MTVDIDKALTPISQARRMLAEAKTMPELRELRDFATGAKAWAKARGMGIEAENEAAEVILRAERGMGEILNSIESEQGKRTDLQPERQEVTALQMVLLEAGLANPQTLDVSGTASRWKQLARLPIDIFERMLHSAREGGERLAKHNFYRVPSGPEGGIASPRPETPEDPDFVRFRAGSFGLLGWQDDAPTRNGLLTLPDDELVVTARLIKALAAAYNEAKSARG